MTALPPLLAGASVPPPVLDVLARLTERGYAAYLVGGCVRDLLLGKPAKDFDVATSARPEEVQRCFSKVIPTGIQHGTVTVLSKGVGVEVTTFRKEGAYLDGRRPSEVSFHTDVEEDLSRRDFTINAMAFDPVRRALSDPFGGQADLAAQIIRCVGDAHARFSEDGLRPLRAVRFAAVLGFSLEPATFAAIGDTLDVFSKVSVERIREELSKLLVSSRPALGLALLRDTRLAERFLPELVADAAVFDHTVATVAACPPELELRVAALLHDLARAQGVEGHEERGAALAKALCLRLKFPNKTTEQVTHLVRWHRISPLLTASDVELRRFLAQLGRDQVGAWLALAVANRRARGAGEPEVQALGERLAALLAVSPALSAKELALDGAAIMKALGVGPSPAIGQATRFLMERVLEDPSLNRADRLTALLAQWWASKSA